MIRSVEPDADGHDYERPSDRLRRDLRGDQGEAMKGRLRFFDHSKGFGYIVPDEPGDHVFVHISKILAGGRPRKGVRCSFDVAQNTRAGKPQAVKVLLGDAAET